MSLQYEESSLMTEPANLDPKWAIERALWAAKMPKSSKLIMAYLLSCLYRPQDIHLNGESPGQRTIASKTGLTQPCVREHVQLLEQNGWVKRHGEPGKRSQYELAVGKPFTQSKPEQVSKPVTHPARGEQVSYSVVSKPVTQTEQATFPRIEKRELQDQKIFSSGESSLSQDRLPWDEDQHPASEDQEHSGDGCDPQSPASGEDITFEELVAGYEREDPYDFDRLLKHG